MRLFVSGTRAPDVAPGYQMSSLSDPEFVNRLRQLNGTPDAVLNNEELLAIMLPILRADFLVVDGYVYADGPLLTNPVTVLLGNKDSYVTPEVANGWHRQTRSECSVHQVPGDHFFLQSCQKQVLDVVKTTILHDLKQPKK